MNRYKVFRSDKEIMAFAFPSHAELAVTLLRYLQPEYMWRIEAEELPVFEPFEIDSTKVTYMDELIRVDFGFIPGTEIRLALKGLNFRWSKQLNLWVRDHDSASMAPEFRERLELIIKSAGRVVKPVVTMEEFKKELWKRFYMGKERDKGDAIKAVLKTIDERGDVRAIAEENGIEYTVTEESPS